MARFPMSHSIPMKHRQDFIQSNLDDVGSLPDWKDAGVDVISMMCHAYNPPKSSSTGYG